MKTNFLVNKHIKTSDKSVENYVTTLYDLYKSENPKYVLIAYDPDSPEFHSRTDKGEHAADKLLRSYIVYSGNDDIYPDMKGDNFIITDDKECKKVCLDLSNKLNIKIYPSKMEVFYMRSLADIVCFKNGKPNMAGLVHYIKV